MTKLIKKIITPTAIVYIAGVMLVSIGSIILGSSIGWAIVICGVGALLGALFM
jgi:hypothetical protein